MLATSNHLNMLRWYGVSLTCPQQVSCSWNLENDATNGQTDKRTALPQQTAGRSCYEELANILVTCYEEVNDKLRTCYEEVTR